MMFPIAPILGGALVSEAAARVAKIAAASMGGSKGSAPGEEGQKDAGQAGEGSRGTLGTLLGIPAFDPAAAKTALIQGAVVTALIVMFFIGLALFVNRSARIR